MKVQKSSILIIVFLLFGLFSCKKECNKSSNCDLKPQTGLCKAAFRKYYYDKKEGKCKEFIWGGCGGVVPFNTLEECKQCECGNKTD